MPTCPLCGADVRAGVAACPECGSDDQTGWSAEADWWHEGPGGYADGDDFDYDEYVANEFPEHATCRPAPRVGRFWQAVAVVVIACLLASMFWW
jgi:hypothetical protein